MASARNDLFKLARNEARALAVIIVFAEGPGQG